MIMDNIRQKRPDVGDGWSFSYKLSARIVASESVLNTILMVRMLIKIPDPLLPCNRSYL